MSGNDREWVQDCRQDGFYGAPTDGKAWGRVIANVGAFAAALDTENRITYGLPTGSGTRRISKTTISGFDSPAQRHSC